MADSPTREFGRRRPPALDPAPPAKRSGHVALLVMGTLAVGGSAYALMPRENCEPGAPGMAAPQAGAACSSRGFSSGFGHGGGGSWSRSNFFGGDPSPSAGAGSEAGVTRGGFGGFARAFTAHFSGGG
jgi:hypothetical protein